ncbi:hypothetical protein ECCB7326_1747, partial [Escherichia coli CB7326]
DTD